MHDTIIENEITNTTTVIYNQIIGTITKLLMLYTLLILIVVVNIINVSKRPLRRTSYVAWYSFQKWCELNESLNEE